MLSDDTLTDDDRACEEKPARDETQQALHESQVESERGAPAAGEAVRDIFNSEEILERIVATAHDEFSKPMRLLFWSGLAAGLVMSLSFLGKAAIQGALPAESPILVPSLLYPLGFILAIMGRYELFTEDTFTPLTLVLTRLASLPRLLRSWGLVFAANVLGAAGAYKGRFF